MKNLLSGSVLAISIVTTLAVTFATPNHAFLPDKTWVIAPRFLYLKDGVSKDEARTWLENEYIPIYRQYPGFNAMLGEPAKTAGWGTRDSTDKEKDFVIIYFFDSKETYDRYFPKDGFGEEIQKGIKQHQAIIDKFFGTYFISDRYQFEDYMMYASSK